jgi:hypothetical protein
MNKNTIQLAKKSTVLVIGLFMQINFAHSQALNVITENSSTCSGDNRFIKEPNYIPPNSDPTQKPRDGFILYECQTYSIPVKTGDIVSVNVRTELPSTKLVINTAPRIPVAGPTSRFMTSQYSKPGTYNLKFLVTNNMTNGSDFIFNAKGEAINNQYGTIATKISPMSITITKIPKTSMPNSSVMPF